MAISALSGLQGGMLDFNGMPVYPCGVAPYGADVVVPNAMKQFGKLEDGVIITLIDAWVMPAAELARANALSWVPVDHDPAPPKVTKFFIDSGVTPVAMSRFGEERLEAFAPAYAPHGIDTDLFEPIPSGPCATPRERAKRVLHKAKQIPTGAFLCLQVGT